VDQEIDTPQQLAIVDKYDLPTSHMVRGYHPIPAQLLAVLRVACMEDEEFSSTADPRRQMVIKYNLLNVAFFHRL
jgi:hypothetical protein